MYKSTRSNEIVTSSMAIIKGIADDGGLYLPVDFPHLSFSLDMLKMRYQDLAKIILSLYLDDFAFSEIDEIVEKAYDKHYFLEQLVDVKDYERISFLELFYGPTLAFKDMALSMLPFLLQKAKEKNRIAKKTIILTATSGDTGSSALSSFMRNEEIETIVLYPQKGVSFLQEAQMLYYQNNNSHAYAIDGNFDDCQKFVKEAFQSIPENNKFQLSSANSINIGRLIPQIVYYYYAYARLVESRKVSPGDYIDVSVPTGNFGNILAAYWAKKMGLPIEHLICASNKNDVLTEFFNFGLYNKNREFFVTSSPSMDILVSSNLERLLRMILEDDERVMGLMKDLQEQGSYQLTTDELEKLSDFRAFCTSEEQTLKMISVVYQQKEYLIDPHTAVAYDGACQYLATNPSTNHILVVSTASPYKFPKVIKEALQLEDETSEYDLLKKIEQTTKVKIPTIISNLSKGQLNPVLKSTEEILKSLYQKIGSITIKTPATSANLGPGFDCLGIALQKYNTMSFTPSPSFELRGFNNDIIQENLIFQAYQKTFERLNCPVIPCTIQMISQDIPISRGLGSSASCIVTGVLAAVHYSQKRLTTNEILDIMSSIEGHPDNVAPCYRGGLCCCYRHQQQLRMVPYDVSPNLNFYVIIPSFEFSTKKARSVLPKVVTYPDAIYNMSHLANLPMAFQTGDVNLLSEVMDDCLHEPYRLPLIKNSKKIKAWANEHHLACCLSGAGPTFLIISDKDNLLNELLELKLPQDWQVHLLKVDTLGAIVEDNNE